MKELWVEKYRPKTIDEYVFRDEQQKKQVQQWIKEKTIPHLLFSGNAGIGKTTLAKLLFNEYVWVTGTSKVAKEYANDFVANGCYVVDLSSEYRYDDQVPLIIPEINGGLIRDIEKPSLIANPNCSVSQMLIAIEPIHKKFQVDLFLYHFLSDINHNALFLNFGFHTH